METTTLQEVQFNTFKKNVIALNRYGLGEVTLEFVERNVKNLKEAAAHWSEVGALNERDYENALNLLNLILLQHRSYGTEQ